MILQTRQFYKPLIIIIIIIIISITLLLNTTSTHGEDESPSIMRRTPSKQTEFFFPLYQNHKKTARRFKIQYSNGQKKQKQEAEGKHEMSTLSLPHTRRHGFDCVFLDFFASSGFSTSIKTKQISNNNIFFTTNTLFSLFFFFGKKHKSRKQNNTLTSEKISLTEEIERALEDLQSSEKKPKKALQRQEDFAHLFCLFFFPSWGPCSREGRGELC